MKLKLNFQTMQGWTFKLLVTKQTKPQFASKKLTTSGTIYIFTESSSTIYIFTEWTISASVIHPMFIFFFNSNLNLFHHAKV